jgi:hypothetical protein
MNFLLDTTKLQGPAPGTFEANILRSITVPYQDIVTSGGQYPLPAQPTSPPPSGPPLVIKLEGLDKLPSFADGLTPLVVEEG